MVVDFVKDCKVMDFLKFYSSFLDTNWNVRSGILKPKPLVESGEVVGFEYAIAMDYFDGVLNLKGGVTNSVLKDLLYRSELKLSRIVESSVFNNPDELNTKNPGFVVEAFLDGSKVLFDFKTHNRSVFPVNYSKDVFERYHPILNL